MSYCGYITTLKNVRPHPNADRMLLGDCFGNTVCVGLNSAEGEIGLYLPSDGQVSEEFGKQNNLLRLYDAEGHAVPGGGYLDPVKRNIKAISLRGVKSDGIFLPIACLAYTGVNLDELNVGDTINVVNGHDICTKYIPRRSKPRGGVKERNVKPKTPVAPLFTEHVDTEQLAYNLDAFKAGDEIEITLKMHGTSQRTGYLPVLKGYKRSLLDRILRREGTPVYDWGYVSGTRRTILENYDGGFYGSNEFRETHSKFFEGKLHKGEAVYYEVVGYTDTGAPIMATGDTPKEYVKQYGKKMEFSYGCSPIGEGEPECYWDEEKTEPAMVPIIPISDIYVYRMTMTNEDGNVVEYTPDFMRYRCEQMGVKTVPVFARVILPCAEYFDDEHTVGNYVMAMAEQYYDGPDPIGKTHTREGVVVRIINRPKFAAYKHKNWLFKCVEGIVKDTAEAPDMEEADGLEEVDSN
jgi:hypothetical protein